MKAMGIFLIKKTEVQGTTSRDRRLVKEAA